MKSGVWGFRCISANVVCLIAKVFNAIDVVLFVRTELAMVNAIVLALRHLQRSVGAIIVSIDNYQARPSLG